MATSHARLAGLVALAALGTGVTFAATGAVDVVSPRTVKPHAEVYPPLDGRAEAADATQEVLGAQASSSGERAGARSKTEAAKGEGNAEGDDAAEAGGEPAVLAGLIPDGSGGGELPLPCGNAGSCVDQVGHLIPDVAVRVPDVPTLRQCTSSIGGDATCFDFGEGRYLLGDGPADGRTELGFCTSSGDYYNVSGPYLDGGVDAACPGERRRGHERRLGRRLPPTAYDCKSLSGGNATCYDLGRGRYIVSDSLADGSGELGFCSDSGYYYVSAPSGKGEAGAKCPGPRPS
jgi:hypothetical protein